MTSGSPTTVIAVSDEQQQTFVRDGVVKIPKAVDPDRTTAVLALADEQLQRPGDWISDTNPGERTNRLFTTRYLWRDEPTVADFIQTSGVAKLAATLMGSSSARFYFDHLLVKEPATEAPTPWHQDIPYWPFLGSQICSVWVACTGATVAESSLEFVRGSHRWDKYFAPEAFDGEKNWTADFDGEKIPDIASNRDDYDIVGFDVEAGDAIAFSSWIVHGAPGNAGPNRRVALSTRWLGDDATWAPHPGCDPTVTQADTTVEPGAYPADEDRFPLIFAATA